MLFMTFAGLLTPERVPILVAAGFSMFQQQALQTLPRLISLGTKILSACLPDPLRLSHFTSISTQKGLTLKQ